MTNNGAIDLARQRKLPFRVNRGQKIDYSILAKNPDGTNYDFSGHTAEMYVYNSFSKTTSPEYTVNVTLSSGELHFEHAPINILREELVYQLWITNASAYRQPWLNGPFLILNREWDHEGGEESIIVSPNGDTITLIISAGVSLASLGLENIDNTSDEDKPVSTAQAAAIEAVSIIKSVELELTSSQILNLHTTPVQYLAPIAANKYAAPFTHEYIYTFGGIVYTRDSSAQIITKYDGITDAGLEGAGAMLTQTFDCVSRTIGGNGLSSINKNLLLNKGLFFSVTTGFFSLGNGTLKIKVLYHVITV